MDQSNPKEITLADTIVYEFDPSVTFVKAGANGLKWMLIDDVGISYGEERNIAPKQLGRKYNGAPKPLRETLVMGEDKREKVTDTLRYPFRCFGQLECYNGDKFFGGSAVLVGPHHALTAAHNAYDLETGTWRTNILMHCGLNGDLAPFDEVRAVRVYMPVQYVREKNEDYDIALLILNRSIGLHIGWLGCLFTKGDTILSQNDIHVTGYPGGEEGKNFKHLWTMANKAKSIEGEKIRYMIPTAGGNSGSPVWLTIITDEGNKPVVVGIHTHGESKLGSGNSGVRLTEYKFRRLVEWVGHTKNSKYRPISIFFLKIL